jgi:hypothetical protein
VVLDQMLDDRELLLREYGLSERIAGTRQD